VKSLTPGPETDRQLDELIELLEHEAEWRASNKMAYYRPHPKQEIFHRCLAHRRWLSGGNATGKTTAGAMETIWMATGEHPYREYDTGGELWAIAPSFPHSKEVMEPKLLEYLSQDRIKRIDRKLRVIHVYGVNGTEGRIGIKSQDQDLKEFAGPRKRGIWSDEPLRKSVYRECLARKMADEPLEFFSTFTPVPGLEDWIANEIEDIWTAGDLSDHEFFYVETKDNPYLSQAQQDEYYRDFAGTDQEASRLRGQPSQRRGLMYPTFDAKTHVVKPEPLTPEWAVFYALDPHHRTAYHHLYLGVHRSGRMAVIAEHISQPNSGYRQIVSELFRFERKRGLAPRWRVGDTHVNASTREADRVTSAAIELARCGLKLRPANKDFQAGHMLIQQAFVKQAWVEIASRVTVEAPSLVIWNTCPETIWQLERAAWGEYSPNLRDSLDPKEKPKKKRIHMLDLLRYLLIQKPAFASPQPSSIYQGQGRWSPQASAIARHRHHVLTGVRPQADRSGY